MVCACVYVFIEEEKNKMTLVSVGLRAKRGKATDRQYIPHRHRESLPHPALSCGTRTASAPADNTQDVGKQRWPWFFFFFFEVATSKRPTSKEYRVGFLSHNRPQEPRSPMASHECYHNRYLVKEERAVAIRANSLGAGFQWE